MSSSSQGPLPIIAPKPPSLEYGHATQYPYLNGYTGLHRANSAASLGLGIHQPQYIMGALSPESYYAQLGLGMTASPTQGSQSDLFDFQIPPTQQPPNGFALPERRHTAHTIIERPVISPTVPFTPPISQPRSGELEPTEKDDSWVFDEESLSFDSDEEDVLINGLSNLNADNINAMFGSDFHAPLDPHGTQVRSFHSLPDENVLVNYLPSLADTPLNDAKTRGVFWYFVNVTAPSLNPYERNPSRPFSSEPIARSDQHIWTCEPPLKA